MWLPYLPMAHPSNPPHPLSLVNALFTELYGFSSERKMASVLVRRRGALRLYNKGAAEMVLTHCTTMISASGEAVAMTEVSR